MLARACCFLGDGQVRDDDETREALINRFTVDESGFPVCRRTGCPRFRNEIDFAGTATNGKGFTQRSSLKSFEA
jgi:hypothetical protein